MNSIKYLSLILLVLLMEGCGLTIVKMYEGAERSPAEQVMLSGIGVYQDRNLSLNVIGIDGKDVDHLRTAEFLLLPGDHLVKLMITANFAIGPGIAGA